jgi:hypothetical protein
MKNTLDKCEENQKFVSFSAEDQVPRTEQIHETLESREAVKFFNSGSPLFIGPGRGSSAKPASI